MYRAEIQMSRAAPWTFVAESSSSDDAWNAIRAFAGGDPYYAAQVIYPVETIVAVAVRTASETYAAMRPARHHDVLRAMPEAAARASHLDDQGFITSSGRFVGRAEAVVIARAARQLIREPTPASMLTSEDVW